jgi:CheY-like chemotaxis protein
MSLCVKATQLLLPHRKNKRIFIKVEIHGGSVEGGHVVSNETSNSTHDFNFRLLLVDNGAVLKSLFSGLFAQFNCEIRQVSGTEDFMPMLSARQFDVLILNTAVLGDNPRQIVRFLRDENPDHSLSIILVGDEANRDQLIESILLGADEYIIRPFDARDVQARLYPLLRSHQQRKRVMDMHDYMKADASRAEDLLNDAVFSKNVATSAIQSIIRPSTELFSGDIFLTAHEPHGGIYIMLGDFTGHGMTAAMGGLPVSETFHAMARKGYPLSRIIQGINRKMLSIMPTGIFCAATFASVDSSLEQLTVYNCGMPTVYLYDKAGKQLIAEFPSEALPMGICPDMDLAVAECREVIVPGVQLVMYSDGLNEARNPEGEQYGSDRVHKAIEQRMQEESIYDSILTSLEGFCQDARQADDISLAVIPCDHDVILPWQMTEHHDFDHCPNLEEEQKDAAPLEYRLILNGHQIAAIDPIPLVVGHIQEVGRLQQVVGADKQRSLHVVLTELFNNALDHGVLELDSRMKTGIDGFEQYMGERQKRLQSLTDGKIELNAWLHTGADHFRLHIRLKDSGTGFDYNSFLSPDPENTTLLFGRGIILCRELCDQMIYSEEGTQVDVWFDWSEALKV